MIGGLKFVNLTLINKFAAIGYPCLFVCESALSYEEGMHVPLVNGRVRVIGGGVCRKLVDGVIASAVVRRARD